MWTTIFLEKKIGLFSLKTYLLPWSYSDFDKSIFSPVIRVFKNFLFILKFSLNLFFIEFLLDSLQMD